MRIPSTRILLALIAFLVAGSALTVLAARPRSGPVRPSPHRLARRRLRERAVWLLPVAILALLAAG